MLGQKVDVFVRSVRECRLGGGGEDQDDEGQEEHGEGFHSSRLCQEHDGEMNGCRIDKILL
jgi:hypothetical protein